MLCKELFSQRYASFQSAGFRGGGLAILLHERLRRPGMRRPMVVSTDAHWMVVCVAVRDAWHLSVANMHLPPSLVAGHRRLVCGDASACLATMPAGGRLVVGDLNDELPPGRSAWLASALASGGPLHGYSPPYRPGCATNLVHHQHRTSGRELDWVLVSADSAVRSCAKSVLPGLSTHLGLLCDLDLAGAALLPRDPVGRRFRLTDVSEDRVAAGGVISGLFLWWGVLWGLSIDGVISLVWEALAFTIPCRARGMVVDRGTCTARAAIRLGEHATDVSTWWEARADATLRLLRLEPQRLTGVSITKMTASAVRLRPGKVATITRMSADGVHFPDTPAAFKEEFLRQAREPYNARAGVRMDVQALLEGGLTGAPLSRDLPDFRTRMRCEAAKFHGHAQERLGVAPTVRELAAGLARGSKAASLDELPRELLVGALGHGLLALQQLLLRSLTGEANDLLAGVQHLPLKSRSCPTYCGTVGRFCWSLLSCASSSRYSLVGCLRFWSCRGDCPPACSHIGGSCPHRRAPYWGGCALRHGLVRAVL